MAAQQEVPLKTSWKYNSRTVSSLRYVSVRRELIGANLLPVPTRPCPNANLLGPTARSSEGIRPHPTPNQYLPTAVCIRPYTDARPSTPHNPTNIVGGQLGFSGPARVATLTKKSLAAAPILPICSKVQRRRGCESETLAPRPRQNLLGRDVGARVPKK